MLKYKIDTLSALKNAGFSTYRIRKEKLIGENALASLRHQEMISMSTLDTLCKLLQCQPGDILAYAPDAPDA